jgi:general stress protein 26
MARLNDDIVRFFESQGAVVVSTVDHDGAIHQACKGIVKVEKKGDVYLMDLYFQQTFENLTRDPRVTVTAVDEHQFRGYALQGTGKILRQEELERDIMRAWEEKLTSRISQRLIRNLKGETGHPHHPESKLPQPQYIIKVEVGKVIDLTPAHIK